jgi:hypothetical protein
MTLMVVDASVALKWFLRQRDNVPDVERALALRALGSTLISVYRRYYEKTRAEGQIGLLANWVRETQ